MHNQIIDTLTKAGHKAFIVGGAVRDQLMGVTPKDFDIVTSALPDEIETLFANEQIVPVGKQFGIIVVNGVEVATFRSESGGDGRRPEQVNLGASLEEDVSRRDFSINGMLSDGNTILDLVGGQRDIQKRIIKFIGSPYHRIEEDKLRMLRAVRFAHTLGFTIEPNSLQAIRTNAHKVVAVSNERIQAELVRMLESPNKGFIAALDNAGLLDVIMPFIAKTKGVPQHPVHHPEGDVFTHISMVVDNTTNAPLVVRLAALLHDIGKPATYDFNGGKHSFHGHEEVGARMAKLILEDLKFPTTIVTDVVWLVRNHMIHNFMERRRPKQLALMEHPLFEQLLALHEADCMGRKSPVHTFFLDEKETISFCKTALLTGNDLKNLGLTPGPEFGIILKSVKDAQRSGLVTNRVEALALAESEAFDIKFGARDI
jgi:putative nucleotidyltransferase with HDIG domain